MSRKRAKSGSFEAPRGGRAVRRSGSFEFSQIRSTLVILVALKIGGLVLIFDPASAQAFDGVKTTFSHATAWLLAGLIALAALRYDLRPLVRYRLHWLVGAFVLISALTVIGAQDRYVALFGANRHLGLSFVLDMAVLYAAVAIAYRTRKDWAILAGAAAVSGVLSMAYGILQYANLDPIPWVDETRVRPPSTFGNPDKFGHFLGVTFVASLAVAIFAAERKVRALAALYALTALAVASLAASRGTFLGVVVTLPVLAFVVLRQFGLGRSRKSLLGIAGAGLILTVLGGLAVLVSPLGERVRGGFSDAGVQQRLFIAEAAVREFQDRPLTGHGLDNFGALYPQYRPPESVAEAGVLVGQDSAHNWLLQALATTGASGTLALVAVVLATFVFLWRGIPKLPEIAVPLGLAAVAYWAQGLVSVGSVSVDWVGWLALGGAAAIGQREIPLIARRRASLAPQAVAVGLAIVLATSGSSAFQASKELAMARGARGVGNGELAVTLAKRAVELDSGRSVHWFELGLAHQERDEWRRAADAFRAAVDRAPYVSAYWSNLAASLANLALAGTAQREEALAAARAGVHADPYVPDSHHALAIVASALGNFEEAIEASIVALRLHKGDPQYETVGANAALRMPDAIVARGALERLIMEKDAAVLRVALARVELTLKNPDAARTQLRRALDLDPQNASALELMRQLGEAPLS